MLRSTSIKNDSWKPVKLLARQSVDSPIVDISCDSKGDVAVVLSESELNIFTNRALLTRVEVVNGKFVVITKDSQLIFVLLESKISCYDSWGQIQWEFVNESPITKMSLSSDGNNLLFFSGSITKSLNRFGEIVWENDFTNPVLDISFSETNQMLISSNLSLFLVEANKEITKLADGDFNSIFCSSEGVILLSGKKMVYMSYNGTQIWSKEVPNSTNISFSNGGIKNFMLVNGKNVFCQDRNGDMIWKYSSTDNLSNLACIESGKMVCFTSNNVFHVLDVNGEQVWTYQAREEITGFTFSFHGGDIILASKSKIHWFQNEGFLRLEIESELEKARELIDKISIYESSVTYIQNDIDKAHSLYSGNFDRLRAAFQILYDVNSRLSLLQKRHVEYLDSLPNFMENLGLQGAQTDDMIPPLYPYYSLYNDLKDVSYLENILEAANYFLLKLNRDELTTTNKDEKIKSKDPHFFKSAKKGISQEVRNIEGLIASSEADVSSFESKLRDMIMDWLKTGQIESQIRRFSDEYSRSNEIRFLKHDLIKDKIDNHMAFVDYSDAKGLVTLVSVTFSCKEKVNLILNIKNESSEIIRNLVLRIKLEGGGLNLFEPASGVLRFEHLNPNEKISPIFLLNSVNRNYSRVVLVIQYQDSAGRQHTSWLGEAEANFLGCYIKPLEINEDEHGDYRLEFKDFNSHGVLNIEGLTINRITKISKEIPGMHLCNFKEESSRSIIYQAAKSSLDDSYYLSMIFLRKAGGEQSQRNILELICHSTDIVHSSELRDEIISYLKTKLLAANGRLV